MKSAVMCMCTAFVFFVAAAVAQTTPPTESTSPANQGTQSSSPSMSQEPSSMAHSSGAKTEHKMKGCIESQNGQYVLQTKRGKDIALTGQDVSAHVGHEVAVHGMWESGMSGMSNTSSGSASASGKSFNVTSVDMISDTCTMGKGKKSGMSGETDTTKPQPQ